MRTAGWAIVTMGLCGACAVPERSVGGSLAGLDPTLGSVALNLSNEQGLTLTKDGPFTFGRKVAEGSAFEVTFTGTPMQQDCVINGGSGKVPEGRDVTTVSVRCGLKKYGVGGKLSGLDKPGLTLIERTTGQTVTPGVGQITFAFPQPLTYRETYVVQVEARPSGRECVVDGGVGELSGTVGTVVVDCAPQRLLLSGEVVGLDAGAVVLLESATAQQKIVDVSGPFAFAGLIDWGTMVDVTVAQQPASAFCWVDGGTFEMKQPRTVYVTCD